MNLVNYVSVSVVLGTLQTGALPRFHLTLESFISGILASDRVRNDWMSHLHHLTCSVFLIKVINWNVGCFPRLVKLC